jgi:choline-sulfatase
LLAGGCARPAPPTAGGPVLLVTFESLRADVVSGWGGPLGLTPHFEALANRASWAGVAVASSGDEKPALASLFTGLDPRHHRVLDSHARPPQALWMMAEAFRSAGYATNAFREFPVRRGWDQGFDRLRATGQLHQVKEHVSGLTASPSFTWIHFEVLAGTWLRQDRFSRRLRPAPPKLPARLGSAVRQRMIVAGLSAEEQARLWALYCLNVAALDEDLGTIVAAFQASGQWDRGTLVVAGIQGLELNRMAPGFAAGLSRQALEAPALVKTPLGSPPVAATPGERVALSRLFATLLESAHLGTAPAAVAPSLFRRAPNGIPSSSLRANFGLTRSWIEGEHQLIRSTRLAAAGPPPAVLVRRTPFGDQEDDDAALRADLEMRMDHEYSFFAPMLETGLCRPPIADGC